MKSNALRVPIIWLQLTAQGMGHQHYGGVCRDPLLPIAPPEPVNGKHPPIRRGEQLALVLGFYEPLPQDCKAGTSLIGNT